MGVAVTFQIENWTARIILRDARLEPHLAHAAPDFGPVIMGGVSQRFEIAAKFDQIAIAVLPIVEVIEVFDNFVESRDSSNVLHKYPTPSWRSPRRHSLSPLFRVMRKPRDQATKRSRSHPIHQPLKRLPGFSSHLPAPEGGRLGKDPLTMIALPAREYTWIAQFGSCAGTVWQHLLHHKAIFYPLKRCRPGLVRIE